MDGFADMKLRLRSLECELEVFLAVCMLEKSFLIAVA